MTFLFKKENKTKENFRYQCDVCKIEVSARGSIPRCMGCGKKLCEVCYTYQLCSQDFHQLSKKDQKRIKRHSKNMENLKLTDRMFSIMGPVFGSIGSILLLLLILLRGFIFYFLFGFLGGFFILCAVLFFFVFHNFEDREQKRIKGKIKEILIPYNIKKQEIKPKIDIDKKNQQETKEYCPSCGKLIKDKDLKYCELCGSFLK